MKRISALVLLLLISDSYFALSHAQSSSGSVGAITLSSADLAQHPEIVTQGLVQSLIKGDISGINLLLPVYQKQNKDSNALFVVWAMAIRAKNEGKYSRAISVYRELIARYPDVAIIRLQLAISLFENHDNESAELQFRRLRSATLPFGFNALVERYLSWIQERNFWDFNFSLAYSNEDNINNAPRRGTKIGSWVAMPPESAQGIEYGFNAKKKWSYNEGIFTEYRFITNGRFFWNNHKYDEFLVRNSVGAGYRDINNLVALHPFLEQQFDSLAANSQEGNMHRYMHAAGVQLEAGKNLSSRWQVYANAEYSNKRYTQKVHLNGYATLLSGSLFYTPSPTQYWYFATEQRRENTRDADNAWLRHAARIGWGYEWPYGVSSRFQVGYGKRQYRGADFFSIVQKANEYSGAISLWHRDLYFFAVTPKITWLYQKIDSNHPFYNREQSRIIWDLSKDF